MIGKWNVGHGTEAYLPHSRGFESAMMCVRRGGVGWGGVGGRHSPAEANRPERPEPSASLVLLRINHVDEHHHR